MISRLNWRIENFSIRVLCKLVDCDRRSISNRFNSTLKGLTFSLSRQEGKGRRRRLVMLASIVLEKARGPTSQSFIKLRRSLCVERREQEWKIAGRQSTSRQMPTYHNRNAAVLLVARSSVHVLHENHVVLVVVFGSIDFFFFFVFVFVFLVCGFFWYRESPELSNRRCCWPTMRIKSFSQVYIDVLSLSLSV